jgi:hypothetical protein
MPLAAVPEEKTKTPKLQFNYITYLKRLLRGPFVYLAPSLSLFQQKASEQGGAFLFL